MISTEKIDITDEFYINVFVDDTIEDIIDKLYIDLFDNFIDKDLKDLIQYKDFKLIFDDRLLTTINNLNLYCYEFNIDEIPDILIDDIKYHYSGYLNKYYDLFNNVNLNYHMEIYKNDEYINKDFNNEIDYIDYLKKLYA